MKKTRFAVGALALLAVLPAQAQTFRPAGTTGSPVTGFGTAVAVGENEILVAEPQFSDKPGTVYLYRRDESGTWHEVGRIMASDGTTDNRFGRAMALQGSRLLLGGTKQDDDLGAAWVFERDDSGTWTQVALLRPEDQTGLQNYGRAVALSGDVALVSSVSYNEGAGMVWIFRRDAAGQWAEEGRLGCSLGIAH